MLKISFQFWNRAVEKSASGFALARLVKMMTMFGRFGGEDAATETVTTTPIKIAGQKTLFIF
jgi:hypothetical protein